MFWNAVQNTDSNIIVTMWESKNLSFISNRTATVENNLAISYKTEQTLNVCGRYHAPWCLPKREDLNPHKNLHIDIRSRFLIIAKTWKQPQYPSVGERINCGTSFSVISVSAKMNEL